MYSIVGADSREYGPVELETLVQWAREGRVVARTTVLDHATGRRFLACDLEAINAVLTSQAVVAPPPHGKPARTASGAKDMRPPAPVLVLDTLKPRRSRIAAGVLGIFLGPLGVHRFYLGYTGVGTLMLCITLFTCGFGAILTGIWGFIEGILCLLGAMTDADGRKLGI